MPSGTGSEHYIYPASKELKGCFGEWRMAGTDPITLAHAPQWCTHLPVPIYLAQRLTLGVLVAQGSCPHVTEPQGALAAAVDEEVAVVWMELGCCDHLREVLHVGWLDIYDVWVDEVKETARVPSFSPFHKSHDKLSPVCVASLLVRHAHPPTLPPQTNTPVPRLRATDSHGRLLTSASSQCLSPAPQS